MVADRQPPPPFSKRFGFVTPGLIFDDFPASARLGLHHLLLTLIRKGYIEGQWDGLNAELMRLGRVPSDATHDIEGLINSLPWDRIFILVERTHSTLLGTTSYQGEEPPPLSYVQEYYEAEINQLFGEERIGYELRGGVLVRPGRPQTQKATSRAAHVLAAPELRKSASHFLKAQKFFGAVPTPDFENAAKEAVSALEAAAKALFPERKAKNLTELLRDLQGVANDEIPPVLVKAILAVYAFRGAGDGIAHGDATGGTVTGPIAEWVLSQTAAHITFLADFRALLDEDVPF